MKNITLFLLTLLLFISCNNDNHFSGYYEEDYEEYVDTVKIEQPQPIIYYYDPVNNIGKDTIVTFNCYNDGFSINGIRYKAEKVTEGETGGLLLFNVTSEETGEYYNKVFMVNCHDNSLMFIRFYESFFNIKDLYNYEMWRY